MNYLIAASRPWYQSFDSLLSGRTGEAFSLVQSKESLTLELLERLNPRYVFFPHWSFMIPKEIYERYECVVFHMTDLPYGRGGSPLQNLIIRNHAETAVSAIRCERELDAGDVYLKKRLALDGSAREIFLRAKDIIADMIVEIIKDEPTPVPQQGEVTAFPRRKPEEGDLRLATSVGKIYDMIRMLDADGYPPAYLEENGFRFTFVGAVLKDGKVSASVSIEELE